MPSQRGSAVVPSRRRLFLDIETSPNIGTFWGAGRKISVPPENILQERYIICAAWKWEGSPFTFSAASPKPGWDQALIETLIKLMDEADEIVWHYGDKFDLRWIRGRALYHGILMSPHYVTVDTKKHASRLFYLNSYKLSYLAKYLNVRAGGKDDMEYSDWLDCMDGNKGAIKKMLTYCEQDVKVLEQVFQAMSPYMTVTSPLVKDLAHCAECGSENVYEGQRRLSKAGYARVQIRCRVCGKCRTVPASRWDAT